MFPDFKNMTKSQLNSHKEYISFIAKDTLKEGTKYLLVLCAFFIILYFAFGV